MKRAFQYSLDEAFRSLWRGRQSGLLSTTTIALALFVLCAFLLLKTNLERLSGEWSSAAEMSVYLGDNATPPDLRGIEALLAPGEVVAGHEYVSKSAALVRFKQTFADLASSADTLGENPLPASFEVRLRSDAPAAAVDVLAGQLRQRPGVTDVRYDREWLNRLVAGVGILRGIGLVVGTLLTLAAALTVANVVRLALHARRDELEIMQLVGAPNAYVVGPFVMEGILQGGIGALGAVVVLALAFAVIRARYLAPLAAAMNTSAIQFLPTGACLLLIVGGMAVGCLGGLVASRPTQSGPALTGLTQS